MLERLYPFWKPARGSTAAGLVLLVGAGALELVLPWPVKWLVDGVFGAQPLPGWMAATSTAGSDGSVNKSHAVIAIATVLLLLGVAHKTAFMAAHYLLVRAGLSTVRNLRCATSDHLHHLSLRYHDSAKVGDLLYRTLYDSYAAQALLGQVVAPVLSGALVLAGVVVVMSRVDLTLTGIAAAAIPLIALTVYVFGRRIERASKAHHDREGGLFGLLQESLLSIRAVQAFTREPSIARSFSDAAAGTERSNLRLSLTQLAFNAAVGILMAAGTAAAAYVGAVRVLQGKISPGDVLVFLAYLGMLYNPISAFAQSAGAFQTARTQLGRVFDVLGATPEIAGLPGAAAPASCAGAVEFRDVTFAYQPPTPVLVQVGFVAKPGTVTAIVGRTGSGKSTIASLLLRFYDPATGAVRLDGRDLRQLPVRWLRRQVSVVLQDAILFSGTVRENIAFGREDATEKEIVRAAERAQADEFIRALPNGYDTVLGERGVNLSGGQRQRIAIARAFVKDAPVLVLDEPTSALDAGTEAALVEVLGELMRGRTTFVIAHRLSTVRAADQILVLDGGRIAERGTHAELLARSGLYAEMCRTQFRVGPQENTDDAVVNSH